MKILVALMLMWATLSCSAQDAKPKLSPEQKVALYQARDRSNAALDKVKSTPEYAAYQKAQEEQAAAIQSALKGVDMKKWRLGDDLEFTEAKAADSPKK